MSFKILRNAGAAPPELGVVGGEGEVHGELHGAVSGDDDGPVVPRRMGVEDV